MCECVREGFCIKVRLTGEPQFQVAPHRSTHLAVFRSEPDAKTYARHAYGRSGDVFDWHVVPFKFFDQKEDD